MTIGDWTESGRSTDPLIGLFGLSFAESGELQYQFTVTAPVSQGAYYLIQMYEWIIGDPSNQQLVPLQWFIDHRVKFYSNDVNWRAAAEDAQRKSEYIRQSRAESSGGFRE